MTSTSFLLKADKVPEYTVHPLVPIAILDHHNRRNQGLTRVVGTLLGVANKDGTTSITNCFPVIHRESEEQVQLDVDYHSRMYALHQRTNPNEKVVGWYSTGNDITYNSSLIHSVYAKECEQQGISPCFLCIDTNLSDNRLGARLYRTVDIALEEGKTLVSRFEEVPLKQTATEAEKIGVDVLIKGKPDNDHQFDSPASISSDLDSLEMSLADLLGMLDDCKEYVDRVQAGEIKGDAAIGQAIANALAKIPHITPENFQSMFAGNLQDMLMIVYLANLTRTQLNITDKISQIV